MTAMASCPVPREQQELIMNLATGKYAKNGELALYRGIGSSDDVMDKKFQGVELEKWILDGSQALYQPAYYSAESEAEISFTPNLVYAGRYSGTLAWGAGNGVIEVRIPMAALLEQFSRLAGEDSSGLCFRFDVPVSAYKGFDQFESYLDDGIQKKLRFIGDIFSDDNGLSSTCEWNKACGAIEVRSTLKLLKEIKARARRVSWPEYAAARVAALHQKELAGLAPSDHVASALEYWSREEAVYRLLCTADQQVCTGQRTKDKLKVDTQKLCAAVENLAALDESAYALTKPLSLAVFPQGTQGKDRRSMPAALSPMAFCALQNK